MLSVEVDGRVVSRPGQVEVLLYDHTGRPAVSHLVPRLEPGEMLVERIGTFPAIIRTSA
jgi:hypothetical protein